MVRNTKLCQPARVNPGGDVRGKARRHFVQGSGQESLMITGAVLPRPATPLLINVTTPQILMFLPPSFAMISSEDRVAPVIATAKLIRKSLQTSLS
jgi:hypothetical protein